MGEHVGVGSENVLVVAVQNRAVDIVADAVLRSRAGLAASQRGSSFLFLVRDHLLGRCPRLQSRAQALLFLSRSIDANAMQDLLCRSENGAQHVCQLCCLGVIRH